MRHLEEELSASKAQQNACDDTICSLRSELDRAHEAVERLLPSQLELQQEGGRMRQRERELGEEVEMLKIKLVLQQQRCEAELQNAKGSYEASLAYLESRARATLGRLAERVKVGFASRVICVIP
jgi:chromosome segregation ATPase